MFVYALEIIYKNKNRIVLEYDTRAAAERHKKYVESTNPGEIVNISITKKEKTDHEYTWKKIDIEK